MHYASLLDTLTIYKCVGMFDFNTPHYPIPDKMVQPLYLAALVKKNECRTSGRVSRDFSVPGTRTDMGLNFFKAKSARLRNSFPQGIGTLPSLSKFKLAM